MAVNERTEPDLAYLKSAVYEGLCEHSRQAATNIDNGKYDIGDDALQCVTLWGEVSLRDFARDINRAYSSVSEYRQVCAFWTKSARAELSITHQMITYTHLRLAMKLGERAREFIDYCNDEPITTDAAYRLCKQWLGKDDDDDDPADESDDSDTDAGKLFDGTVEQVRQDVADELSLYDPSEFVSVKIKRG